MAILFKEVEFSYVQFYPSVMNDQTHLKIFFCRPNETRKPRTLNKLKDTSVWEKRKHKGKLAIQKMVVDLMELYIQRLKQKRPTYPKNSGLAEFAAKFPYTPTPDQQQV